MDSVELNQERCNHEINKYRAQLEIQDMLTQQEHLESPESIADHHVARNRIGDFVQEMRNQAEHDKSHFLWGSPRLNYLKFVELELHLMPPGRMIALKNMKQPHTELQWLRRADKAVFFHGARAAVVPTILRHGLLPGYRSW